MSMFKTIFSCNLHPISCSTCEFDHIFFTSKTLSKFPPCRGLLKYSYLINNLVFSLLKPKILVQIDCGEVLILNSNPFYFLYNILFKILSLLGHSVTSQCRISLQNKNAWPTWRWYSSYSHYAQWCGSFNCHQKLGTKDLFIHFTSWLHTLLFCKYRILPRPSVYPRLCSTSSMWNL